MVGRRRSPNIRSSRAASMAGCLLIQRRPRRPRSVADQGAIRCSQSAVAAGKLTCGSAAGSGASAGGRPSNEQRHAALFATVFRNSALAVELLEVRFADPDTAIVEARLPAHRLRGSASRYS